MNHAISINSDKTLVITLPEGTQVDRVMIRNMGTQESKLYWRDEVLDQYKWERDIAIQQLKELGYGFGQEPKTDGDTISRKAAVSRISDLLILELKGERIPTWNEVYRALNELPSVQSELAKYSPKLDNENGELISRQAAIDALAKMMPRSMSPDGSHPADEEIFKAQEIFVDCIKAIKILPSAKPQWIPCFKRLPSDSDYYLVTDAYGDVSVIWFAHEKDYYGKSEWRETVDEILAWMPCPEPYREDGEKK